MMAKDERGTEIPASHVEFLKDRPLGFLATVTPKGNISVNPVAVMWDGYFLRVSTVKSRQKYKNLAQDARVAVCAVDRTNFNRYVEVRGHAEMTEDTDRTFIDSVARSYMGADQYPFDEPEAERVTVKIVPSFVSAPRIPLVDQIDQTDEVTS